jgi:hypothetical protein
MRRTYPREEFEFPDGKLIKRRKRKPPAPGGLYDVRAACDRLSVTEDKLRAFVMSGQLKFINVGHGEKKPRYRFAEGDLQEMISKLTSQESPPCPSSKPKRASRSSGLISNSVVVGFMAARAARLENKLKNSKR